jgi:hypothetical protein
VLPPKIGVVTFTVSPSTTMSTLLVSTVRSSLTDSATHHVATLVVLREQDEIGRVAAVDHGLHRRGHRRARQSAGEIAGCVGLGGAVLAERAGDGRGVAGHERRDGATE